MQTQSETASKQLEATERPWLKVDFGVSKLAPDGEYAVIFGSDGGLQMSLVPVITNTGHSVATNVFAVVKGFLAYDSDTIFKKPLRLQSEVCDKAASTPLGKQSDGSMTVTIFPGDTDSTISYGLGIDKGEIDSADNAIPNASPKRLHPIIVGCVDYQYGASPRHHQTRFILDIRRIDHTLPKDAAPTSTIQMGIPVRPADLNVVRYAFGGFWAD